MGWDVPPPGKLEGPLPPWKTGGDVPLPGKLGGRPPPPLEKLIAREERPGTYSPVIWIFFCGANY